MNPAIVIIGRPGSGKSTLANSVAGTLGLDLISSGEIARKIARSDAYARAGLEQGGWAPESAVRLEVQAQMEAAILRTGAFVLEGFPRRLEQLIMLEQLESITPRYFYLQLDQLTCIRRLVRRGRPDDHPDAIATRFRHFDEWTGPMLQALGVPATGFASGGNSVLTLDGRLPTECLVDTVAMFYRKAQQTAA